MPESNAESALPSLPATADAFLGGKVTLLQPERGPRAGLDAVFLAASCPVQPDDAPVLDAGAGSGAVSICLARRVAGAKVTGVEIDSELCRIFRENVRRNGMEGRISVVEADLTVPFSRLEHAGLRPGAFSHVLANPPFHAEGSVRVPANAIARRAHVARPGEGEAWVRFLTTCCAARGTLTIIHQATALPELLSLLQGRFGGLTVFPLFARAGEPAIRVLVQGIKGSRAAVRLMRGLVLHENGGAFTAEAQAVLRHGERLLLG